MTNRSRRLAATTTLLVAGLAGSIAPAAAADEAPTDCDLTALTSAVDAASAQSRAAQKAYTTRTRMSMKALAVHLKAREAREARVAAAQAKSALARSRNVARDDAGSDAARQARAVARVAKANARVKAVKRPGCDEPPRGHCSLSSRLSVFA